MKVYHGSYTVILKAIREKLLPAPIKIRTFTHFNTTKMYGYGSAG
jgi:hypothetical protein